MKFLTIINGVRQFVRSVDFVDISNNAFRIRLTGTSTADQVVTIPNDSGTFLLDDRPIGSLNGGVSVRGYFPNVTVSGLKILALSDGNTSQICINASTITIPLNASVAYPIGTEITIFRSTTSTIALEFAVGVTVTNRDGETNTQTTVRNHTLLKKVGTDIWMACNPVPDSAFLAGNPTTTTQSPGTNNNTIANTAFVQNAVAIAGASVNPSGVSVVDFSIPAGVRRLTLLSNGLISTGAIVRLGTSSGVLGTGYNSITHYYGQGNFIGIEATSTDGITVPKCSTVSNASSCMTFYRMSPNGWNSTGQGRDGAEFCTISIGNILLSAELTTLRYINPTTMTAGSLQLLWEF